MKKEFLSDPPFYSGHNTFIVLRGSYPLSYDREERLPAWVENRENSSN